MTRKSSKPASDSLKNLAPRDEQEIRGGKGKVTVPDIKITKQYDSASTRLFS